MALSRRLNFMGQSTIADPQSINIADAGGYFTTDNVEAALQEAGLFTTTHDESVTAHPDIRATLDEKANIAQEAWITPTLLNGWTGTLKYRKNSFGHVEFKGNIKGGTSGSTATTLIAGYRPIAIKELYGRRDYTSAFGISLYTSGGIAITTDNGASTHWFDGLTVPLD